MSIINTRNLRRLLGSQSFKDTAKAIGKDIVKDNILLESNRAINGLNKYVSDSINDTTQNLLKVPISIVNEVANTNSTHEGTGTFTYNPNNNYNYNYDLASNYLNQYNDYIAAKQYINSTKSNLAYQFFRKEQNNRRYK